MARRGKSSIKPAWIIAAVALLACAFLGSRLFFLSTGTPFRTTPELDVQSYLDNANSLRGNVYKIEGEIGTQIAWSPSKGRLIEITVNGKKDVLPVLVPIEFNQINIQKGQKFFFMLEVGEDGILTTKKLEKS